MSTDTNSNRVVIFDTTLRDGEQSPGASMTLDEKLRIAEMLEELGVDVIEAGFPIASDGDFEAVREISKLIRRPIICGLARSGHADIERAAEALKPAKRPRIHTFVRPKHGHASLFGSQDDLPRDGTAAAVSRQLRRMEVTSKAGVGGTGCIGLRGKCPWPWAWLWSQGQ